MPLTLGQVKAYVFKALGSNDSVTDQVANRAINEAIKITSRIFEPPELIEVRQINYPSGSAYVQLPASISKIYDAYLSSYGVGTKVLNIPIDLIDVAITSASKPIYSVDNNLFYFRPIPSVGTTIYSKALTVPSDVLNDTDYLPFSNYDYFIISISLAIAWSAFEETESVRMFQELSSFLAQLSVPKHKIEELIAKRGTK